MVVFSDTEMVAGKIRKKCKTFTEAEKLFAWVCEKDILHTEYGQFIHGEYDRLYPSQPKKEIQWSRLDLY
jgi:hypothetical protein